MPTDCRGTLRRTVRSRNNRIATAVLKDALPMTISAASPARRSSFVRARAASPTWFALKSASSMSKLHPATRRRTLRMLAAVPYLLLPRSVLAAPSRRWTITGARVEEFDSLDAVMQRLLQRYAVRAGSLAVARQRKLLFARGYTWAEPDYPVTQADSPFRLASVSKAFTAAVIYQLLQAKKLELTLPVFPWLGLDRAALPGQTIDPRLATITVQQLINHRGG